MSPLLPVRRARLYFNSYFNRAPATEQNPRRTRRQANNTLGNLLGIEHSQGTPKSCTHVLQAQVAGLDHVRCRVALPHGRFGAATIADEDCLFHQPIPSGLMRIELSSIS